MAILFADGFDWFPTLEEFQEYWSRYTPRPLILEEERCGDPFYANMARKHRDDGPLDDEFVYD